MKKLITLLAAALLSACDYIPVKTIELTTVDGRHVLLTCPDVPAIRSSVTYVTDKNCTMEILK